jgi:hypothetical protein
MLATLSSGTSVLSATASALNVVSMTLAAGDWEVSALCGRKLTAVTASVYTCSLSPTSGVVVGPDGTGIVAAGGNAHESATFGTTLTGTHIQHISNTRVATASAASLFLTVSDTYSAGTVSPFGAIKARRVR